MCEVSYKANCAPAARLFIPVSSEKPPQFLTPPPSPPIFSLDSTQSLLRSPYAVRCCNKFVRVSSLREKSGLMQEIHCGAGL